ncbi:hypothetical protein DXG01_015942, partial [Tephrocybe rancida]
NFINDEVFADDNHTAGPQQISRQLAASAVSELEWEGLIECAEQHARHRQEYKQDTGEDDDDDSGEGDSEVDNSEEDNSDNDQRCLETMGLTKLWRVAVK